MGHVVPFAARPAGAAKPKPERPGEVTLFPGVRYERDPEEGADDPPSPAPERRPPGRPDRTRR